MMVPMKRYGEKGSPLVPILCLRKLVGRAKEGGGGSWWCEYSVDGHPSPLQLSTTYKTLKLFYEISIVPIFPYPL